jgi:outer membrane lipoprotein LolB
MRGLRRIAQSRRVRRLIASACVLLLAACASTPRAPLTPPGAWDERVAVLQALPQWQLDGRTAVAVGTQGWQASLNWHEQGETADVHLSGPLGVGALVLKRTAAGVSLNGAAPSPDVVAQLEARLGFALPLDRLRFWLLGVPDPGSAFELSRNPQDRAAHLAQDGWSIDYESYLPVAGDVLPGRLVLSREGVRVRIAVDHWTVQP